MGGFWEVCFLRKAQEPHPQNQAFQGSAPVRSIRPLRSRTAPPPFQSYAAGIGRARLRAQ